MIKGAKRRNLLCGVALAAGVIAFGAGVAMLQHAATAQETMVEAPIFEVDPLWPKPLPNEALLGQTIGISIDDQDNVWITHRSSATLNNNEKGAELPTPVAICCRGAPPVIAFNPAGDVIHSWGGPGQSYEWPESMHGIFADSKGNIYTTETYEGKRVQKFNYKGIGMVRAGDQGVVWPKRGS